VTPAAEETGEPLALAVDGAGQVSGLYLAPADARACYVLAHGAGAGMRHPALATTARELAARGVATLRYQFPYMERGGRRPDPPGVCHATVRAAVAAAARLGPQLPLFAGGRSFGGRMTSQAQAAAPLPAVRGLIFLGFPLHPAGKPGTERARHLQQVQVPMLFVQGTRDELAGRALLEPVVRALGARAALHWIEDADHSFHVRARSGRDDAAARAEVCAAVAGWIGALA